MSDRYILRQAVETLDLPLSMLKKNRVVGQEYYGSQAPVFEKLIAGELPSGEELEVANKIELGNHSG